MCLKKTHSARLKHISLLESRTSYNDYAMGLSDNPYAWDIQSVVTMDDLFVL